MHYINLLKVFCSKVIEFESVNEKQGQVFSISDIFLRFYVIQKVKTLVSLIMSGAMTLVFYGFRSVCKFREEIYFFMEVKVQDVN